MPLTNWFKELWRKQPSPFNCTSQARSFICKIHFSGQSYSEYFKPYVQFTQDFLMCFAKSPPPPHYIYKFFSCVCVCVLNIRLHRSEGICCGRHICCSDGSCVFCSRAEQLAFIKAGAAPAPGSLRQREEGEQCRATLLPCLFLCCLYAFDSFLEMKRGDSSRDVFVNEVQFPSVCHTC